MSDAHDIEQRAALLRARRDDPDWSERDQQALDEWLDASTAHRVAWLRMEYGWQRIDRLAALRRPDTVPALVQSTAPSSASARPRRWLRALSAVAAVVGAITLGLLYLPSVNTGTQPHGHATQVGGRETVALDDGSRVELNTDTALRTLVSARERSVWLDRGEAYFEVAHDPEHPFAVTAGAFRVVVLGTKFGIRRDSGQLEVVVVDGRVRVEPLSRGAGSGVIATRDKVVVAKGGEPIKMTHSHKRVEDALAWRDGKLVFDNSPLAEVVIEFNRYNDTQLLIKSENISAIRISGSFEATNLDAFVRLLNKAYGLRVQRHEKYIDIAE